MSNPSEQALKNQKLHFMWAVALVGVSLFGLGKYVFENYHSPSYQLFEPKVDLPVDEFKSKEVWMDRLEAQVQFLTQKQNYYEETLLEYKKMEKANEQEKAELKRHLAQLRKELSDVNKKEAFFENEKQENSSQIAFLSP